MYTVLTCLVTGLLLFPSLASGAAVGFLDSDFSFPGLLWACWVYKGPAAVILLFGFFRWIF